MCRRYRHHDDADGPVDSGDCLGEVMEGEASSSGPPGPPRWQQALWAGVGILVAGLGVLGYALVVADGVYPTLRAEEQQPYGPGVTLGFATACAVPAVAVVAWVFGVTWSGAKGRLTAYPLPRFLVGIAVLLLGIGIWFAVRSVQVSDAPFAGDRALLVTSAYGFVLVGTVLVHVAATRLWSSGAAPRPWSRRDVVEFVAGVTAVALAAGTAVAVVGEHTRVDATTAAAVQAPSTPRDPTRLLWRWSERTSIREVVAAGAGVVVATHEGIVALDGRTGQERWHYRRTDTSPGSDSYGGFLVAVDGGRGVITSLDGRLHAFDAFTGELRWRDEEATAQTPPPWNEEIVATDTTVVRHRYSPVPEFVGTHVRTGEPTWRYASEHPECGTGTDVVGDTVIIGYYCGPEDLVGLDGATGELLWRIPDGADKSSVDAGLINDRGVLRDPRSGRELRAGPDGLVMASDSGEIITSRGLFEAGDTAPRWDVPDTAPDTLDRLDPRAATFLGDVVVVVNDRSCPGQGDGLQLIVADRADGTVRRSFECAELPAVPAGNFNEVISAPGAVIVHGKEELVAVG